MQECKTEASRLKAVMERAGREQGWEYLRWQKRKVYVCACMRERE